MGKIIDQNKAKYESESKLFMIAKNSLGKKIL